eukprot:m.6292 g.6292  ORF g.6292 m.6292 type:complete len:484 (+) comp15489_c0_seq2:106-1557(+)
MGFCQRRTAIVVCIVSFLGNFLMGGNLRSSGILYDELLKRPCNTSAANSAHGTSSLQLETDGNRTDCGGFGSSRGVTAWTASTGLCLRFVFSPISGFLADRYGCRVIALIGGIVMSAAILLTSFVPSIAFFIFFYGVLGGIGWGLLYNPTIVILSKHWHRYHALANGFAVSGAGIGAIALGPLSHYLIEALGWRGHLRVMSSLFFVQALLSLSYVNPDKGVEDDELVADENDGEKKEKNIAFHWDLLRSPVFVMVVVAWMFISLGYTVPIVHLVRFAGDVGISRPAAALLVTYQGVSAFVGRVGAGIIGSQECVDVFLLFRLCILLTGLPMFALPFADSAQAYWAFATYAVAYAITFGGAIAVYPVVLTNLVGRRKLAQAFGWSFALQAPCVAVSTPIAGWIHDATGSYQYSFYFGGSAICVAFAVLCGVWLLRRRTVNVAVDLVKERLSSTSGSKEDTVEMQTLVTTGSEEVEMNELEEKGI